MRQNNRKQNIKKERIIMIASSAFVMAALTMTGVYMKENSAQNQDDGYSIDFTGIESQAEDGIQEAGDAQKPHNAVTYPQGDDAMQEIPEDDLDYLPMEEAGSSLIQIPGLTDGVRSEADVASDEQLAMLEEQKATEKQPEEKDDKPQESGAAATEPIREQTPPAVEQPVLEQIAPEQPALEQPVLEQSVLAEEQPVWDAQDVRTLAFSSDQGLVRPVSGDILIPYSMDRTVYFTTLDQYKYNPATVYRVEEGTQVMACAEGRVASVFRNEEIGQAVTLDLGNGYQVVYGQLQALNVAKGIM